MQYRKLGKTDLDVSAICLGTMTWGEQNSESDAHEQMDYAVNQGINFFDAAEMYPVPPRAETQGSTETYIGNWMAEKNNRDKIILATKVTGRSAMTWVRDDTDEVRQTPAQMREALEKSLRRLKTDYIDLYQLHWPDRPMSIFGNLGFEPGEGEEEDIASILETLGSFVSEGKVRHIGLSNETPWGVSQFLNASRDNNLPRIASIQNAYNLLNRTYETGLSEFQHREKVGLLAYSPLAFGALSGKYIGGKEPDGARLTVYKYFTRYTKPLGREVTENYFNLARRHNMDPAQMALQFVTSRWFVTANIIGARTMDQLKSNIASIELELSDDLLKEIEEIHRNNSNPCP